MRFGELRIRASPRVRPEVRAPVPVTRSTPAPLIASLAIDHADLISAVRSDDLWQFLLTLQFRIFNTKEKFRKNP